MRMTIDRLPSALRTTALRSCLLTGVAAVGLLATPALAQDAGAGTTAAPDDFNDDSVIIVQARRQDETLQEVPVTITSVGAATLEKYNVDEVSDVASRVPTLNVQVGGSGSGGQIALRGVGSSNISASFDSAVAFDYDGVQVSTMRLVQAAFVDSAQIDVLKGPQSLYFGKSASAGVFSIRSADPTPTWEIGGKASYEFEEKGWLVGGFISGPITDTLGIRIAGQYNDIDEYLLLQDGTPAVNQERGLKNILGRLTLDWEPVPGFDANLKVQYSKNENDGAIAHSDLFCGANGVADPVVALQGAVVIPAGYDCQAYDSRFFLPDTAPPLAGSIPLATGPSKAEGFNGVPFGETEILFARLKLDLAFTDNLTLTAVTGFIDLDATDVDNYSYGGIGPGGIPFGLGTSDPRNTLKQYSQELRLTSDFDGAFNFMLGGFYEWRKFGFDTAQNGVNISLVAPDPITGYTFDWDKEHITKTDAASIFGSVIFDLTDQLELSGGVRYTKENKTQTISVPYVHAFLSATPAFLQSGFFSGPIDFTDDNISPEATIKYQVNPDVNVFASFKTGFKSGGIDNSALPSNSLSQAAASGDFSSLVYKSEKAIGGEIGFKSQFANRTFTLNGTAFYYVFDDLQVQVFNAVAVQFVTTNAGEVTTKGVDLGWNWRTPVEGLNLSGNLAYLDAQYSASFVTFKGVDLEGRDAPGAPNWSGNLAFDWEIPMGDSLAVTLNGNAIYSGSYFTNQTSFNDFVQGDYVSFDGAIAVGDPDGAWKLSLIGVNLTDNIRTISSGDRPFLPAGGDDIIVSQNRGRQVFVEASFRF
jgi:iron complex outermembrane receptor protein